MAKLSQEELQDLREQLKESGFTDEQLAIDDENLERIVGQMTQSNEDTLKTVADYLNGTQKTLIDLADKADNDENVIPDLIAAVPVMLNDTLKAIGMLSLVVARVGDQVTALENQDK